jgi:hypothetical protein
VKRQLEAANWVWELEVGKEELRCRRVWWSSCAFLFVSESPTRDFQILITSPSLSMVSTFVFDASKSGDGETRACSQKPTVGWYMPHYPSTQKPVIPLPLPRFSGHSTSISLTISPFSAGLIVSGHPTPKPYPNASFAVTAEPKTHEHVGRPRRQ